MAQIVVFGKLSDHKKWLAVCKDWNFTPTILFPVGIRYVVAAAPEGELFMRRNKNAPPDASTDYRTLSRKLKKEADEAFVRLSTSPEAERKKYRWKPKGGGSIAEKFGVSVS